MAVDQAIARLCDGIPEGLEMSEAEDAEMNRLGFAYDVAARRALAMAPSTLAGVRAMLGLMAVEVPLRAETIPAAIETLLTSPALAG